MPKDDMPRVTLGDSLRTHGISRRSFLRYCTMLGSAMALPPALLPNLARALETARRPSIIWLSFQECTGCTESLTRAHSPTLEQLILNQISLDYHHTLQAAAGDAAEHAREQAMEENKGKYIVVVDGSLPAEENGFSTIAGISNRAMLEDTAKHAAAIIAVGTCAAFGGIPAAWPNPTGAVPVSEIIRDKPIINVPGCPPIPVVITGTIAHFLTFGTLPELDDKGRPKAFFGDTIHDRCYRRPFYDQGKFAHSFDDEGARKGWCLYEVGCKGPTTYNACATIKWNQGTSFPIQAGHPCLGCSEPDFWDAGSFYKALSTPLASGGNGVWAAATVGVAGGVAAGTAAVMRRKKASKQREETTVDDLKEGTS